MPVPAVLGVNSYRPRPPHLPHLTLALDRDTSARSYTADGFLRIASSVLTTAEISPYAGSEIPDYQSLGLAADRTYSLFRDPGELKKAVATFCQLPLLITHRPLSADDFPHELVVGATGDDAQFNDRDLTVTNSLVVWSAPAIHAIETGERRDLSVGYRYQPIMSPGIFRGQHFDGVMSEIIAQHVALVDEGRVRSATVADALPVSLRRCHRR